MFIGSVEIRSFEFFGPSVGHEQSEDSTRKGLVMEVRRWWYVGSEVEGGVSTARSANFVEYNIGALLYRLYHNIAMEESELGNIDAYQGRRSTSALHEG